MKPLVQRALLISALALSQTTQAGSRSATFQATFTVVESCAVQASGRQPSVQCQLATPYSVSKTADNPVMTQSDTQAGAGQIWTVTF